MKTTLKYLIFSTICYLTLINVSIAQEKTILPSEKKSFISTNFKSEWGNLIVLDPEKVSQIDMIDKVQEEYVKKLYPDYHIMLKIPIKDYKNRFVETLSLMNIKEEKVLVHFDMTNVYQHLKSKDKETKAKIEELESYYMIFNKPPHQSSPTISAQKP